MISFAANNPNFTKSIITGDETWCFQYDLKTKRQSATWKSPGELKVQKTRQAPSKIKAMLIAFYDSKGLVHYEFLPSGQTVTGAFYLEVLRRLVARIRRVRPEYKDPESWCLLHDNASSHNAIIGIVIVNHVNENSVSYCYISFIVNCNLGWNELNVFRTTLSNEEGTANATLSTYLEWKINRKSFDCSHLQVLSDVDDDWKERKKPINMPNIY